NGDGPRENLALCPATPAGPPRFPPAANSSRRKRDRDILGTRLSRHSPCLARQGDSAIERERMYLTIPRRLLACDDRASNVNQPRRSKATISNGGTVHRSRIGCSEIDGARLCSFRGFNTRTQRLPGCRCSHSV